MARIREGDEIGAGFLNNHEETWEWYRRFKARGEGGARIPSPVNFSKVMAANYTDPITQIHIGEVCEFDGNPFSDLDLSLGYPDPRNDRWVKAVTPNGTRVGWGIALDPLQGIGGDDRQGGEFLVLGVCHAKVVIENEDHLYAERRNGERVLHSTATKSACKILHKPALSEGGELPEARLCLVQIMDEAGEPIKIVRPDNTLIHAAWGGPSNLYDTVTSGGLVETYGNYVAGVTNVRRKMYAGNCKVYDYDEYGDLSDTGETISVYNPGALPCYSRGTYEAKKFGSNWIITNSLDQFAHHRTHVRMNHYLGGTQDIKRGESKFLDQKFVHVRNSGGNTNPWDVVHIPNSGHDVFIRYPGQYKVTYGATVQTLNHEYNEEFIPESLYQYRVYLASGGLLRLWKNFNPDDGVITAQFGSSSMDSYASFSVPPPGGSVTIERTTTLTCKLADWHGGPYTRLSLSLDCGIASLDNDDDTGLRWHETWIVIEPLGSGGLGFDGVGMNPFLGEDPENGFLQWWGGGPAPAYFDADGVWLP